LGRRENEEEIRTFLSILKHEMKLKPDFFVADYKSSWEVAMNKVFPNAQIIRCGFHTVQLINRALTKDLNRFSRKIYGSVIKEIRKFYQTLRREGWKGKNIEIKIKNKDLLQFRAYQHQLEKLFIESDLTRFKSTLNSIYGYLDRFDSEYAEKLKDEIKSRVPRNGLTKKNFVYFLKKLKGAFSLVLRQFRLRLEEKRKEFNTARFLLFKRPERLSTSESTFLDAFLRKYPQFEKYRLISIRISNIYHLPYNRLKESIITGIELWKEAHNDLKAAINTIRKNKTKILNFIKLKNIEHLKNPPKSVRSSPEYQMRKIKKLIRRKYGFRNKNTTKLLLQKELKCPVIC